MHYSCWQLSITKRLVWYFQWSPSNCMFSNKFIFCAFSTPCYFEVLDTMHRQTTCIYQKTIYYLVTQFKGQTSCINLRKMGWRGLVDDTRRRLLTRLRINNSITIAQTLSQLNKENAPIASPCQGQVECFIVIQAVWIPKNFSPP